MTASAIASVDASASSSTDNDEEVAENIGGGSGSVVARIGGECSVASLDLGGDFVDTALQGMCGGPTTEPSNVAPMPSVLGNDSSGSEGEGVGGGNASPSKHAKADSTDRRRPTVAPTVEVSEDEVEAYSPAAPF